MKQQSLIDLIGWGLFVLIIYLVISALYGCGTVKPTQPVYDDWGAIKPWQYGQIVEPEFEEQVPPHVCVFDCDQPFCLVIHYCKICGRDQSGKEPMTITINGRSKYGQGKWIQFGDDQTINMYPPEDDNLIEWHGYIIIDVGDSLITIKNN